MRKDSTALAVVAGSAIALATAFSAFADDPKAPITVWVDANREPQAQAYKAAHPDVNITIDVVDPSQGSNTSKIALAVKAKSGIPDVVFLGTPDELATLSARPISFPMALNTVVPKATMDGFGTTLARCTYGGKVMCLGNDIGQTVFWYNKPQFAAWGYTPPKTFDEFKALGDKLAKEHPGYNLGTVNGRYGVDAFFGSSGCPVIDATSLADVRINTADPKCARVGEVIGPMIANGSLSTLDLFDKNYTTQVASGKVVGMIGASWVADYAFKPMTTNSGTDFDAKGKFAAAPMPTWSGESSNWSGAVGGGIWVVSNRASNVKAAVDFAVGMTTSPDIAKTQATYPAYGPSADIWLKAKAVDSWYAADPSSVLKDAGSKINPADGYVRYQTQALDAFNQTVIANGATDMTGSLKAWGDQLLQAAQSAGYTVTQ
ncbi:MAG TPA: ABC transporter substrate-binding protein [Devosiaceae bacterium]|nr:ABC transporter substrate-binding protein [Devosiaceae bacterium]